MKTMKFMMLATFLSTAYISQAQVAVKVDKHYGAVAPSWASKAPSKVQYYYLPDIQTYYDVPAQRYIYQRNGTWIRTATLPTRYSSYDLYHGQTVYLTDYKGNAPYAYYKEHRVKYVGRPWKINRRNNGNHFRELKGNDHKKEKGHGKK